jgi:hypothetical protein
MDCSDVELTYYKDLSFDIFNRTQTAMSQDHCFKVCELSLTAQAMADARSQGVHFHPAGQ